MAAIAAAAICSPVRISSAFERLQIVAEVLQLLLQAPLGLLKLRQVFNRTSFKGLAVAQPSRRHQGSLLNLTGLNLAVLYLHMCECHFLT